MQAYYYGMEEIISSLSLLLSSEGRMWRHVIINLARGAWMDNVFIVFVMCRPPTTSNTL